MATTGEAFGIAAGIYLLVCLGVLLAFDLWRRTPFTKNFYAPLRYIRGQLQATKPKRLPNKFGKWVLAVVRQKEWDVISTAGVDAAMYLKVLKCGLELFFAVTIITWVIILPINWTGREVDVLLKQQRQAGLRPGEYVYWVSSPGINATVDNEASLFEEAAKPNVIETPDFYEDQIPPAPPGLEWWKYKDDVPLLPQPKDVLGPNYTRFGWRYDATYQEVQYRFSDLDKSTMANIESGSSRLLAHAFITWLVSVFTFWHMWRYNKDAVRLRTWYLLHTHPGAESHTVLVTDIPGILFGTVVHRVDKTLLRFLPKRVKQRLATVAVDSLTSAVKGLQHVTVSKVRSVKELRNQSESGAATLEESQTNFDAVSADNSSVMPTVSAVVSRSLPTDMAEIVRPASKTDEHKVRGELSLTRTPSAAGILNSPRIGTRISLTCSQDDSHAAASQSCPSQVMGNDAWGEFLQKVQQGSSVEAVVAAEFRTVYGEEFNHAHLVRDTTNLDPLVKTYHSTLRMLTDLVDHYLARKRRNKKIKPKMVMVLGVQYGKWGLEKYGPTPVKVHQLEFLRDRLIELWKMVAAEQKKAINKVMPAAFVTFKTRTAQVVAADALMSRDTNFWRCKAAPGAEEVVWANLGWRKWERGLRLGLTWTAFFVLAIFFMIPVTAVQGLLTLNSVTRWLAQYPIFNALLTAILPGLALKIFLIILPFLISMLNFYSGMTSKSDIDLGVVTKFFIFQVITVFFGSFVAGSFANQLKQFIGNPSSIITVLGTAAPQTAIFFMSYILLQGLLSKPLSLLRLPDLIKYWVFSLLAATERAKARLWQNQILDWGTLVPDDTMAILLGLVFCIICPLISGVALVYFMVAFLVWKYQLLYVYRREYESGGKVWARVMDQVCFVLFLFQLVMVGILGIKRSVAPPLIVLPLPFITFLYWLLCRDTFLRPQEALALADAAALDAQDREQGALLNLTNEDVETLYLSPSFKINDDEYHSALCEADSMLAWLATEKLDLKDLESCRTAEADYQSVEELQSEAYMNAARQQNACLGTTLINPVENQSSNYSRPILDPRRGSATVLREWVGAGGRSGSCSLGRFELFRGDEAEDVRPLGFGDTRIVRRCSSNSAVEGVRRSSEAKVLTPAGISSEMTHHDGR